MLNLMEQPLIRYQSRSESTKASLPQVYAALMTDKVEAFPGLRPHQCHSLHAFFVQLGAIAMHRAGINTPPETAEQWATLIRGLTPDFSDDEPWQLVVEDITKPAFMQPPACSAEREADYKTVIASPDELDMLVTSKNHDLKATVAAQADLDDWVFALVTLQTMEGYGGVGNHGISRMNGGLGNRPAFTLTPLTRPDDQKDIASAPPPLRTGTHVRRDMETLLERRTSLLNNHPMTNGGIGLLWTVEWDGTSSLPLNQLDPFFIEVCRRVRLVSETDRRLFAIKASSKATRLEAKEMNGRIGDPWTPIDRKGNKSLTLAAGGFTYKRISEYLDRSLWTLPILFAPTSAEEHYLVARAMVRGQGKTEGYHERIIPLRRGVVGGAMLGGNSVGRGLDVIAKERVDDVRKVQRILSHAIQVFIARGDSGKVSPEHRNLARPWLNRLDEVIDTDFFEDLQDEFEAETANGNGKEIRDNWLRDKVIPMASGFLSVAEDSLPCPAIYRYRSRVAAEGLFDGRVRSPNGGFPDLFDAQGGA